MAFDQATANTGFSVYKNQKLYEHGKISLKNKDTSIRVKDMFLSIAEHIDIYKPSIVYVEGVALQSNVSTLSLLARLQGMIIGYCYAHNVTPKIIKPSEWRKKIGFTQGKTKQANLKQQAKEYIKNKYNITATDDECEAICIGEVASIIEGEIK